MIGVIMYYAMYGHLTLHCTLTAGYFIYDKQASLNDCLAVPDAQVLSCRSTLLSEILGLINTAEKVCLHVPGPRANTERPRSLPERAE